MTQGNFEFINIHIGIICPPCGSKIDQLKTITWQPITYIGPCYGFRNSELCNTCQFPFDGCASR
ncbi:hypothetical protein D3C86_1750140 [compost metagenome]